MARNFTAAARRLREDAGELLQERSGGLSPRELADRYGDGVDGVKRFAREILDVELTAKQVEMARRILADRRVVVRGANSTGKDFGAMVIAMYACYVLRMQVLVTSATNRQVEHVNFGTLWRFARKATDLDVELYRTSLWANRNAGVGIIGFTSTESSRVTGMHHENGVLVIVSECQGVEDDVWDGLLANTTGERDRVLAVGNPLSAEGMFYRVSKDADWTSLRIPASSVPNVREGREVIPGMVGRSWVEDTKSFFGSDSDYVRARIEAEFPEDAIRGVFRRAWLETAAENHTSQRFYRDVWGDTSDDVTPPTLGVDVAREGDDRSVVAIRRGPRLNRFVSWSKGDTMETVEKVEAVARDVGIDKRERAGRWRYAGRIIVDAVVMPGVLDRLTQLGWPAEPYKGSEKAKDKNRYTNRRTEAYWHLRERLEREEISLPDDPELHEELMAIRWQVDTRGRVQLERKKDLKARLGRSPDKADAAVMSYAAGAGKRRATKSIVKW